MKIKSFFESLFNNWFAKICCLILAVILYSLCKFNNLEQQYLSVSLNVIPSSVFSPGEVLPSLVRVHLRGEQNTTNSIKDKDIYVYVDFSEVENSGNYRFPVKYRLSGIALEADPLEVTIEPSEIEVKMEQKVSTYVNVTPSFKGYAEKGYEFSGYEVNPSTVEISGPKSIIDKISDISTEPIEVSGRNKGFTDTVSYNAVSPLISISGPEKVVVDVKIQKTNIIKTYEKVPVRLINQNEGLSLSANTDSCSIQLTGAANDMELLKTEDLFATADCSQIKGPGVYTLKLAYSTPSGLKLNNIEPEEITVVSDLTEEDLSIKRVEAQDDFGNRD